MVGDLVGAVVGHVTHTVTGLQRRCHVDVVVADAVTNDGRLGREPGDGFGLQRRELDEHGFGAAHRVGHLAGVAALMRGKRHAVAGGDGGLALESRKGAVGDDQAGHDGIAFRKSE